MMWDGAMAGWMIVWSILILAGLVAIIMLAVRTFSGGPEGRTGGRTSARRILDERYARGEISDEEYRQRRQTLE
ncbi:SHOCT domain-containing protein [Micromonospora halophytica]|uniref:Putative membrane protein n=1 Tax=Micromonospora halophytica TaxID=47864 RepID=A0A1C5IPQ9_9ACTN|nr:SHOCT domain-containing protein [Micromonospora halophytica]SCG60133.1 putative membrane protein [Micromonospora halophytica]